MAKGDKPTALQQKAIDGIRAVLVGKEYKPLYKVLIEVGYAPSSARQWTVVMEYLRPHLQPTVDWLELHRARIQQQMDEKIDRADYADLVRGLKAVTEAIQLLGGKPTQRISITPEDRARLDELIDD